MRHIVRLGRICAGFVLLVAGVAMIVLPGPGVASIALGLALLAPDFRWAKFALDRMKETGARGAHTARVWWRRFRTRSSVADDGRLR